MITELGAMVQKEWTEALLQRGNLRGGLLNLAVFAMLLGVVMPLQCGTAWLTNPLGLLVLSWLPIILTANMVTDAFAGERERNTLETLLASRLSDRAILFGKMLASILYSWSLTLVSLLIGVLTVNAAHPENGIRFYSLGVFLGTLGVSWMAGTLMAAVGVLVSLKSPNVRNAYQKLTLTFLMLWAIPGLAPRILPSELLAQVNTFVAGLDMRGLIMVILLILVILDLFFIFLATRRFRRNQLITE